MSDDERVGQQYDAMAQAYAADIETNAFNAYYERPATIRLLGDVEGKRVLDVGCGPGALTSWLIEQGATVTAIDVSQRMVDIARARVGERAKVLRADLARPLRFLKDGSIDVVVASLVLHYLRDWDLVFREFRRVLDVEGVAVFSTHHPAMDWQLHRPDDYFAIDRITETWSKGGRDFPVTFWRRPLQAMTLAIAQSGFVIESLSEPEPAAELSQRDPAADRLLRTEPAFLFFRIRPVSA
ncbi:MAG: class I SAM-dependent methyltransferase [Candidatus Dormiibacterota bacterium]